MLESIISAAADNRDCPLPRNVSRTDLESLRMSDDKTVLDAIWIRSPSLIRPALITELRLMTGDDIIHETRTSKKNKKKKTRMYPATNVILYGFTMHKELMEDVAQDLATNYSLLLETGHLPFFKV